MDATVAPEGSQWVHEIKHDGYRLMVHRQGEVVRLFTRRGKDCTDRYPAIEAAALNIPAKSFLIDGEAVVLDEAGISDFTQIHRQGKVDRAMLYAFDVLNIQRDDIRLEPLIERKNILKRLLRGRRGAIIFNHHMTDDGPIVFEHACKLKLEGIVSKRIDSAYESGRSYNWLKTGNPDSEAMTRYREADF